MTGLDHHRDRIIEICCIITDGDLNTVGDTFHRVVHQSPELLAGMDEWCTAHHGGSGLTERVLQSRNDEPTVAAELLAFLQRHIPPKTALLAGNSVHMDRLFMLQAMPQVVDYLHYRILDVSSIFEAATRFAPAKIAHRPSKVKSHTAESDIKESIEELRFYRENVFSFPSL